MFGLKTADDAIENAAASLIKPGALEAVCKKASAFTATQMLKSERWSVKQPEGHE
jgi:hypothetical protein